MQDIACPVNLAVKGSPSNMRTNVHYKQESNRIKPNIKNHVNNKTPRDHWFICFLRSTSHEAEHGILQLLLQCGWTAGCCPKSKACHQRLAVASRFYCVLPGRQRGDEAGRCVLIHRWTNKLLAVNGQGGRSLNGAEGEKTRPQWAHIS